MKNTIRSYIALTRINKPVGIMLLLWPTCWALWLAAGGMPSIKLLSIFIAGVLVMRPAGCIINDIADQSFDRHVKRTKNRPLATQALSSKQAWLLFIVLCAIGLVLVCQLNEKTIILSAIALCLAMFYPLSKRFFPCPQLILGLGWYISILMAFTATLNHLNLIAWLLYIAATIWTIIYDTMYALCDKQDDEKLGLKSSAIYFGGYDRAIILLLQIVMLAVLALIGYQQSLNAYYFLALLLSAVLFAYHQWLIKDRDPTRCFKAFIHNQWVGATILLGIILGFMPT